MALPTNTSFAEEVKTDRLKALYRITAVVSFGLILGLLTFGSLSSLDSVTNMIWLLASVILMCGSIVVAQLLQRRSYGVAAWTYVLSTIVGIGVLLYNPAPETLEIVPFIFPVIIFIGGLLLSPLSALGLTVISSLVVIIVPQIGTETTTVVNTHQFFSIVLMFLSAGLAAQVTGELYQITQWALDNYKKERRTNEELFEKRQALQLSLRRSEALGDKLQETNSELEVAHDDAEEAKHFRGQFLANMSHELRTPLNAIIGFSETMLQFPIMYDNEELAPSYQRDLNQIYNSGRQLLHVINDILDLAKVDAGKLEVHMASVEADAIMNAVMATAKGLLGSKTVRLSKSVPENMPLVWADETRLRQVLLNLYSNACKYTDDGSITLTVTELTETNEIQFTVTDTGIGIDAEFHDSLFEEFQQAKHKGRDPRSGSGLGLAISRQLLELMGGRIWMESTLGKGSTFHFTIQKYAEQDKNGHQETIVQPDTANNTGVVPEQPTVDLATPKAEAVE
ncbi:MAG: ATP-binding protein [Anaerolineae bacterium]|nr:ATP-binding protein [Anaerolineae bacterium]MDQ7033645.1 ATP-binding protein [Anaerolineae bacterium]